MTQTGKIYVLGCGSIGCALAAYLAAAEKDVVAVRTSAREVVTDKIIIKVRSDTDPVLAIPIATAVLSQLSELDGIVVVTAKSYANASIASSLARKIVTGPLVIMQNGIGVENAFLESQFTQIYRCVLYATAQTTLENEIRFRPIASSPIGAVKGTESDLSQCLWTLTTPGFPFHLERNIQRDIWKKAIINSVFNSICPLLDVDNGIFVRDEEVAELAKAIVLECLVLAQAKGVSLSEFELMQQIFKISHGSDGVLISTLQDLQGGRETEIASLNLELVRLAASMNAGISLPKVDLLGRMISAKSRITRK